MNDIVPIFIVGFCVLGTYKVFELFAKRKERLLMIEKLPFLSEDKDEQLKFRIPFVGESDFYSGFWPLRISLLLIGIGCGCLLSFFIQLVFFNGSTIDQYRELSYQLRGLFALANSASISTLGGIGLLIAFLIEHKMKAKRKDKNV